MAQPFYVTERISDNRYFTKEGFLVCIGCPITRTGTLKYSAQEVPVTPGPSGEIIIYRNEDEVFKPETIASFVGKPITNNHPPVDVNPENWKDLVIGTILHPRRGEGTSHNCLVADLMFTEQRAIDMVLDGKVELSCGYDVDYEELSPGIGRHFNIVGNHLALVDQGRAGPQCAVIDEQVKDVATMRTIDVNSLDLEGMGSTEGFLDDDAGTEHVHVHVGGGHTIEGDTMEHHMGSSGHHGGHFSRIKGKGSSRHSYSHHHDAEGEPAEGLHERISGLEDAMHHMHRMVSDLHRGRGRHHDDDDRHHGRHHDDNEEEYERYEHAEEEDSHHGEECDDDLPEEFEEHQGHPPHHGDDRRGRHHRDRGRRHHRDRGRRHHRDTEGLNMGGPIEGKLHYEAPPGTGDRRRGRGRDAAAVSDAYRAVVSMAEIICPGLRLPTYDSVMSARSPGRFIHDFRCRVMDAALGIPENQSIVEDITGTDRFNPYGVSPSELAFVFRAVAQTKRRINNGQARARVQDMNAATGAGGGLGLRGSIKSPQDLNEANRKFWASRSGNMGPVQTQV